MWLALTPSFSEEHTSNDCDVTSNFKIETEGVKNKDELHGTEKLKITAAKKFFESMQEVDVRVRFEPQLKNDDIAVMLEQVVQFG